MMVLQIASNQDSSSLKDYVFVFVVTLLVLNIIGKWNAWFVKLKSLFNPKKPKPVLVGLHISHYVEKVRWALDLLDVEYEEQDRYAVLGLLWYGETLPILKVDSRTTIGDSVDILYYLSGRYEAKFAPSNANFLSVHSLSEKDRELLKKFDKALGTHIRRYIYGRLLTERPDVVAKLWSSGTTGMQKILSPVLFVVAKFFLIKMLQINQKTMAKSKEKADAILDEIDERLCSISNETDGKRKYLSDGERFSILDLTFCALVAPLVTESLYGRGGILPTLDDLGPTLKEELLPYQSRPFAKYVHEIYRKHRLTSSTPSKSNGKDKKNT